jgi:hypothetical protein
MEELTASNSPEVKVRYKMKQSKVEIPNRPEKMNENTKQ